MDKEKILVLSPGQQEHNALWESLRQKCEMIWENKHKRAIEYLKKYGKEVVLILYEPLGGASGWHDLSAFLEESGMRQCIPVVILGNVEQYTGMEDTFKVWPDDIVEKELPPELAVKRICHILELYQYRRGFKASKPPKWSRPVWEYEHQQERNIHIEHILLGSLNAHNVESFRHIRCVEAYTKILAEHYAICYPRARMTQDKIHMIVRAARLHDVGKLMLPDYIVSRPGRLSDTELDILKQHTILGGRVIEELMAFESERFRKICYNVCRYHHERYDGSGYPDGLSKDRLPLEAQLVALADMYDVLIHTDNGNQGNPNEYAYYMLMNGECGVLSPKIQEVFRDAKEDMAAFCPEENDEESRQGLVI